jgi:hypothetical protein
MMSGNKKLKNSHKIELLQKQIDLLQEQVKELEMKINRVTPVYPTPTMDLNSKKCSKCGMVWKGVMGYVCTSQDCPVQLKVGWQAHNTSSVDPADRSWYYDGDGTKRSKE